MGSPPIERAFAILDFLTTHPGRGFTASEVARQLALSKSTTHTILTTLADRAIVLRDAETLEFRLGPGLVPMGAIAERTFPALGRAKREAARLADEYDAACVLSMAAGDDLLIVGRAGTGGPLSSSYLEGQRHPLVPPLGLILYAWSSDAVVDAWFDRLGDELTPTQRKRYRAALATIRRQGYGVGIRVPALEELSQLYGQEHPDPPRRQRDVARVQAALARDGNLLPVGEELPPHATISSITAPVFGPHATLLLAISLLPVGPVRPADMPELARAVVRSATRVTTAIDGRPPQASEHQAGGGSRAPAIR